MRSGILDHEPDQHVGQSEQQPGQAGGRPAGHVLSTLLGVSRSAALSLRSKAWCAGINFSALTASDAVDVLRARARQLSHEQARLLATMVEVGCATPTRRDEEWRGWPSA